MLWVETVLKDFVQTLIATQPDQARQLLASKPQLAYALFQAMLLMNIVDPSVLQVSSCPMSKSLKLTKPSASNLCLLSLLLLQSYLKHTALPRPKILLTRHILLRRSRNHHRPAILPRAKAIMHHTRFPRSVRRLSDHPQRLITTLLPKRLYHRKGMAEHMVPLKVHQLLQHFRLMPRLSLLLCLRINECVRFQVG